MNLKVFISHASEDKERFVIEFATKLRSNGIDAWLDKWEMFPGDSLVDKIFEEGLKEAEAIVVILSKNSVDKPWVTEELNASIVKRINKGTKIIPIVLDNCNVPECLQSTLWEKINDLTNYKSNFERIISSILGQKEKPPLGSTPEYMSMPIENISGLVKTDNLVLKLSCEYSLENNEDLLNPGVVFVKDTVVIIPEEELAESFEVLDREGYLKLSRVIGTGFSHYQITTHGLEEYAKHYYPNYENTQTDIIAHIVNNDQCSNQNIHSKLGIPIILINHVLELLELNNHINLSKLVGGMISVYNESPSLKRMLQ